MGGHHRAQIRSLRPDTMIVAAVELVLAAVVLVGLAGRPALVAAGALALVAVPLAARRLCGDRGERELGEIQRLSRAEVAVASAATVDDAARELADHALELLRAPAAVVLIEGPDGTHRAVAGAGEPAAVYDTGSRMRLLEVDGQPCGSIAVAARTEHGPYEQRDEQILDALAQRVSVTLHRLALFDAVRAERRKLADVFESSSDGIFSTGPDYRVRSWNPAMAAITGRPAAEVFGEHCCTVLRPTDAEGRPLHGAACPGRRSEGAAVELRLRRPDGEERWLTCTFSALSDGGYVAVARDVTAAKEVERLKADFLATVSHELRTPLTPIQGFLQTLLRDDAGFDSEQRRRVYDVMLRESQRLVRLIDDLLETTTLEDVEGLLLPEALDWRRTVVAAVEGIRRQDPSREVRLQVRRGVPRAVADEQRAEQVLANLLTNAVKYSPAAAPITVTVSRRGDEVATTVADCGPGVPAADRDRIFERFVRLGDHMTRAVGGAGLGLFIARRLVEGMGGRIWCADAPGGGAAFTFTLPVHRPTRPSGPGPDAGAADAPAPVATRPGRDARS